MLKTRGYGKIVVADGKRFEMKIGPVYYNGIVYRPTTERFRQWYDIISTRPWFSRYDFWVEGSFANNLNLKPKWPTWDIDLTLTIKDEIYYNNIDQMNEVRDILIDMSNIALHQCNFYMDTYFTKFENNIPTLAVGDSIWGTHPPEDFIEWKQKHILSYAEQVYRNGVQASNWPIGELVVDGLWKRAINFPSPKQVVREVTGRTYKWPVNVKEYYGTR